MAIRAAVLKEATVFDSLSMIPETAIMSFSEWNNIPDYENNRKVENRCKRKGHLNNDYTHPAQLVVSAVRYHKKDGTAAICKIDGHSRTYSWNKGYLPKPSHLKVNIFTVANEEERYALYQTFDSKGAGMTPSEEDFTGKKEANFAPTSDLCLKSWKTPLSIFTGKDGLSMDELYREASVEMNAIDSLGISVKGRAYRYPVGIKLAMLMTMSKNEKLAKEFWGEYDSQESSSIARKVGEAGAGTGAQVKLAYQVVPMFDKFLEDNSL